MSKVSIILMIILLLSISALVPISAAPAEVWVDDDGPDNGTDHFDTIQEGINAVEAGGTVHVAAGTYSGQIAVISPGKSFTLVAVEGPDTTILENSALGSIIYVGDTSTNTITIDGFTLQNGNAYNGGGLYCTNGSIVVRNCTFYNNSAGNGAAMYLYNSDANVAKCTFYNNIANYGGGGIFSTLSDIVVTNCIFSCNVGNYAAGGLMSASSNSAIITNCTFYGNSSIDSANGIYSNTSNDSVTNCILWDGGYELIIDDQDKVNYCCIQGGFGAGTGNIADDPLFVNAPLILTLRSESPCIDAGIDTSSSTYGSVTDDIVDVLRPKFDTYDMGAYEALSRGVATWSPIVMKPLVTIALSKANTVWECLLQELPEGLPENIQVLFDEAQTHMANAIMLSNPVYANWELNKATEIMKQINDVLECGCHLD